MILKIELFQKRKTKNKKHNSVKFVILEYTSREKRNETKRKKELKKNAKPDTLGCEYELFIFRHYLYKKISN